MGVYRRKAQYHETDQMGIIHHSNYVKWMEEARIDFMKEMGFGYGEVEKRGTSRTLFLRPCFLGALLRRRSLGHRDQQTQRT